LAHWSQIKNNTQIFWIKTLCFGYASKKKNKQRRMKKENNRNDKYYCAFFGKNSKIDLINTDRYT
jgi:hypothetical protein